MVTREKNIHVINSSSKLHTSHTEKTIKENAINCKKQEVNENILSINVHMYTKTRSTLKENKEISYPIKY
jgi:hypothetical protein